MKIDFDKIDSMTTGTKLDIDIKDYINSKQKIIDNNLKGIFQESTEYSHPKELWDAVRYSLLEGGKRIRGILCIATYESLVKGNDKLKDECLLVASLVEIIHTMSLIHDDLPCMDNDDLRRGKPSCHKAFSEATAILAGDAMLTLPFYLIIQKCKKLNDATKIKILEVLSHTTTFGLVPGQILDLALIKKEVKLKTLEKIYSLKTAELIKASIVCGALLHLDQFDKQLSNELETINKLSNFGRKVGIAFQIVDDILDITTDTKTLGKTSGKDEKLQKPTYPMLIGLDKSKEIAKNLVSEGINELKDIPIDKSLLSLLSEFILNRIN